MGEFFCPECGYKKPDADYFVTKVKEGELSLQNRQGDLQRYEVFGLKSQFSVLEGNLEKSTFIKIAKCLGIHRGDTDEGIH